MKKIIVVGITVLLAVIIYTFLQSKPSDTKMAKDGKMDTALEHAKKHLNPKYVCPMHPQIVRDQPGSCPICGMNLVAKKVKAVPKRETALEHAKKHLNPKYVCPMHPQIVRDKPGNCPICGMDLVLKKQRVQQRAGDRKILYYKHPHNPMITSYQPRKDEMGMDFIPVYDSSDAESVTISPSIQTNMGVRTAKVENGKLWRKIKTVGFVMLDEDRISHIHMRAKGWIQNLKVRSEGDRVKKGQLLYEFYSPDLVNAQEEYLQAVRSGQRSLISASRDKLIALAISEQQIKAITKERRVSQLVQVYAHHDGIVIELHAREGMYVKPEMKVMTLADLSTVWLMADVFESQSDWVKTGQSAEVTLNYKPGKVFEGKVDYIYPRLDPKTRTLKVRLRFSNKDEVLKPNMYADVSIYGGPTVKTLMVPRSALIRTGSEQRVILAQGNGNFKARRVVAGIESGEWVQILAGIKQGETVVTSGQFLIDSEASINASIARMSEKANPPEKPQAKSDQAKSKQANHAMAKVSDSNATKKSMKETSDDAKVAAIGFGEITEVDMKGHRLKVNHDPIKTLKWPSMNMWLGVDKTVSLKNAKQKQRIKFQLRQGSDGYVITHIDVLQ